MEWMVLLTKKLHVLLLQQAGNADTGLHGQQTNRVLKICVTSLSDLIEVDSQEGFC